MPKGVKTITTERVHFHKCGCGYEVSDVSKKLVELKGKLHSKKCNVREELDVGRIRLPIGITQHNTNLNQTDVLNLR